MLSASIIRKIPGIKYNVVKSLSVFQEGAAMLAGTRAMEVCMG
jgi:hypothetical protein